MRVASLLLSSLICLLASNASFAVVRCNEADALKSLRPLYAGDWKFLKEVIIEDNVEEPVTVRLYSGSKFEIHYCMTFYCLRGVVINQNEYRYIISVNMHEPGTFIPHGEFSAILDIRDYCLLEGEEAFKGNGAWVDDSFIKSIRDISLELIEHAQK